MTQKITIIGGGPGGYTAAFEAAKAGAEVTLIEAASMGGTCLNWGCIPTKTFKASAEALEIAHRLKEFGISGECNPAADMAAIVTRKAKVVGTLRGGLEKTCAKYKVNLIQGRAEVVSANLVRVRTSESQDQEVTGDRVIIATGSRNLDLPSLPVDHTKIITSDDALELDHVPERMLVVGGGVIGSEMACIFQVFGSTVTIVEGLDRILPLPTIDQDMSKLMHREMKKRKIVCEVCRTAVKAEPTPNGVSVTLGPSPFLDQIPPAAQKEKMVEADVVLVAVGRVPNTEGLGLAQAGVETDQRGWILADQHCQTSQPGIYAIGDALGPSKVMLAHVAVMEGMVAARNCLGINEVMSYDVIPSAVFTTPEVATVGLTEAQATEQGYNVSCVQSQFRELGKAQAMGELSGVFKLIVDADSDKLLGAHLAGAHVSDIIAEPTLALALGARGQDIARTIHAHPTLAEGLFDAAHLL
ncbi:MAG: dihydrolipoyl dehydrogenase [Desulfovermiculus sp.]|nr:dihydrolipoyl dehydrogenase [Desulfovermiculus sp.]